MEREIKRNGCRGRRSCCSRDEPRVSIDKQIIFHFSKLSIPIWLMCKNGDDACLISTWEKTVVTLCTFVENGD
ncbi:hypothetical protein FRX31_011063 [Thalictrum thalictroides]|uniref:Uncharacterized protein n=1 Tax=Thalictrum thalictroides TaxID=46969 RepID=A0A7J6WRX8_THATH|nr:hypothetical protein FRX31_011063 [Thalictrum thalictroides]